MGYIAKSICHNIHLAQRKRSLSTQMPKKPLDHVEGDFIFANSFAIVRFEISFWNRMTEQMVALNVVSH